MARLALVCIYPYASVTVKTARRRMRCRICGREIAKGEEYAVLEYRDGPFRRRKAVCIECARVWVRSNILCEARRQISDTIHECVTLRVKRSLPQLILEYYGVIPGDMEMKKRAQEECRRMLEERGVVIRLWRGMVERAKRLGLKPEEVVREVHPKARIEVVE